MLQTLLQPQVLAFLGVVLALAMVALGRTHGLFVTALAAVFFYIGFVVIADIELTSTNSAIGFVAIVIAIELFDRLSQAISPAASNIVDTLGYWVCLLMGLLLVAAIISYAMGYEPTFINNLLGV